MQIFISDCAKNEPFISIISGYRTCTTSAVGYNTCKLTTILFPSFKNLLCTKMTQEAWEAWVGIDMITHLMKSYLVISLKPYDLRSYVPSYKLTNDIKPAANPALSEHGSVFVVW